MAERRGVLKAWATHQLAGELVRDAARALGEGARVMPLKGVLVARLYYDDVAARPMVDCDVLAVRPEGREAVARLERAGFVALGAARTGHVVTMASPRVPALTLDLHLAPLPVGFGAVTTAWMVEGAREDEALFGARVLVPDARRYLAFALAKIARDHVFRAPAYVAEDVRRVLARGGFGVEDYAATIGRARLRRAAWMALEWARERGVAEGAALQRALRLGRLEQALAARQLEWLRALAGTAVTSWKARAAGRVVVDDPRDVLAGLAAGVVAASRGWARRGGERT